MLKVIATLVVGEHGSEFTLRNPLVVPKKFWDELAALSVLLLVLLSSGTALGQNLDWAKLAGGVASGIAVDDNGNSYVTGQFSGTATFGAGEVNETVLTAGGDADIFVAKYNGKGRLLWVRQAGGSSFAGGAGIAVDHNGVSYVTGSFVGTVTFGAGEANETVLTAGGDVDIFVAKYNGKGRLLWVRQAGGSSFAGGAGIAVDHKGSSYVTGDFSGTAIFGVNETFLVSDGPQSTFVARYLSDKTRSSPLAIIDQ